MRNGSCPGRARQTRLRRSGSTCQEGRTGGDPPRCEAKTVGGGVEMYPALVRMRGGVGKKRPKIFVILNRAGEIGGVLPAERDG